MVLWIDPTRQLLANLGVTVSNDRKHEPCPVETTAAGAAESGTQLEINFASEVRGRPQRA